MKKCGAENWPNDGWSGEYAGFTDIFQCAVNFFEIISSPVGVNE